MNKNSNPGFEGTQKQFMTSLEFFREVMCSKKYTVKQKDNYFENLCQDYMRCDINENDKLWFRATMNEWERRRVYELFM